MSQHVQRVQQDNSIFYVLLCGLLLVLVVYYLDRPRTAYVETVPSTASIYLDNKLLCEQSPCELDLPFWPSTISVRADGHAQQDISILNLEHFTKGQQKFSLTLTPHIKLKPKVIKPPTPESYEGILSTPARPEKNKKPESQAPQYKPKPRAKPQPVPPVEVENNKQSKLCYESEVDRRRDENRSAILCYDEDSESMQYGQLGVCYATYDVSRGGRVSNIIVHDCTHKALMEQAARTFAKRHYLPALTDSRPVNSYVSIELEYGKVDAYYNRNSGALYGEKRPPLSFQASPNTINRDASVISCPPPRKPARLTRSGFCIFDFDLTETGRISTVRQTRCTQEGLRSAALASLNKCKFNHAISDEKPVSRAYMSQQINIDMHDSQGRKIPPHAAFRQANTNKPYIVYD